MSVVTLLMVVMMVVMMGGMVWGAAVAMRWRRRRGEGSRGSPEGELPDRPGGGSR